MNLSVSESAFVESRPFASSAGWAMVCGLAAGVLIAGVVTLSKAWAVLILAGLAIGACSLLARNFKHFWLAVFLAAIPINVTKLLFYTPDDVLALKRFYKIVVNENLAPQLYVFDLPFLVLLAIWFVEIVTRKSRVRLPREALLIAAFLAWCLFTLVGAPAPFLGLVWAFYEIKVVLVLLWLVNASLTKSTIRLVVATAVATVALQSAITVVNYRWQLGPDFFRKLVSITETQLETRQATERGTGADYVFETGTLLRGTGSVGAGNAQAKFFVALLPLALAFAFASGGTMRRFLGLSCFALGVVALYLTYSRGGLLMGLLGTGTFLFLRYLGGYIPRKTFVMAVVVGTIAVGAAVPYLLDFLTSRPGFLRTRFDHISHGLEDAADSPLTGVGVNNFNVAVREKDREKVFSTMPIHNHYLRLVIEIGVLGLALQLWLVGAIVLQGYRLAFARDEFLATVSMALVAGVISILVYWTDDIFYDVIIRTQFWVLLGLILVIRQIVAGEARPALAAGDEGRAYGSVLAAATR